MSLSASGDFQVLLQTYKYKSHCIWCTVKIHPNAHKLYDRRTEKDYHWMTASRWAKIESALWRLFEDLHNWQQDAYKLNAELQIDHIKVQVKATEEWLTATKKLLQKSAPVSNCDLGLDLTLEYMSHEDIVLGGTQPTKRKHSSSETERSSHGHTKPLKPKNSDSKKSTQEAKTSSKRHATSSRKRERRSVSQGGQRQTLLPQIFNSSREHVSRKETFADAKNTNGSPPAMRRSTRNMNSGEKTTEVKVKTEPKATEVKAKTEPPSTVELTESGMNALSQLSTMLDIPKPPKVKILLLDKMTEVQVMETFDKYQTKFDIWFKKCENKPHTASYLSLNHPDVMDILNKEIRSKMITRLGDVYSKKSSHGSLVINGLLPLWIICLFMDEYGFPDEETAASQIKAQLRYSSYLKALNDDPLPSDLDDSN